jgi:hypothetical protein
MERFDLVDVDGKAFLLRMANSAYGEVERSLRDHAGYGVEVPATTLEDVVKGMRNACRQLAVLCDTESVAIATNAEEALFDAGLTAARVERVTVPTPARDERPQ